MSFNLDKQQQKIWHDLKLIANKLNDIYSKNVFWRYCCGRYFQKIINNINKIKKYFLLKNGDQNYLINCNGLYLYGPVGTGKTMLLKRFYNSINRRKLFIHHQIFISNIHKKLHLLNKMHISREKKMQLIVDDYVKKYDVICVDEFEITDLVDGLMIESLYKLFIKNNIFIICTSNFSANDLYAKGFKANIISPFRKYIIDNFINMSLNNNIDYRSLDSSVALRKINSYSMFIYDKDKNQFLNKKGVNYSDILSVINQNAHFSFQEFTLLGRKIKFQNVDMKNKILKTNMAELIYSNKSYNDYNSITNQFKLIILDQMHVINSDENNIVTRFIQLIDQIYLKSISLIINLPCDVNELYKGNKKNIEFKRAASRLNELKYDLSMNKFTNLD